MHAFVMSDITDNPSLKNETKTLLWEAHVENGFTAHKNDERKVELKEIRIPVQNPSTEERHNDLGWPDDESYDAVVDNTTAPTMEETEK